MHPVVALVDEPDARYAEERDEEGNIEASVAMAVGNGEGNERVEEDTQERRHGRQARTRREPCKLTITCYYKGIQVRYSSLCPSSTSSVSNSGGEGLGSMSNGVGRPTGAGAGSLDTVIVGNSRTNVRFLTFVTFASGEGPLGGSAGSPTSANTVTDTSSTSPTVSFSCSIKSIRIIV